MDKPTYSDEPPAIREDAAGMMHIVFRSEGEVVAHIVMDRLNYVQGLDIAEKALDTRRRRGGTVTPIRPPGK